MSGTFSGFSEDDIKKVQNGAPSPKSVNNGQQIKVTSKNKRSAKPMVRFDESKNKTNDTNVIDIPEEAKLCKSITNEETKPELEDTKIEKPNVEKTSSEKHDKNDTGKNEKKPIDLDNFQARQKLIEEQNRRRKELLIKALADKRKRTQEETQRLNDIQSEFKKLDAVLANDVKLLRKKIEIASIDYMEAQKRYLKIEKEFLDAKFALQQKLEKKELLTEHLCTIIEQNEERKAEKLRELLNKLELSDVSEAEKEATEQ